MLRIGDILDGKYRILALIGKGGMSKVWLAMDNTINKEWAIKEIDKKSIEYRQTVNENETLSEIEIMKKLDHPSLPRIVNVIDTSDTLYVIMDYIEGETLLKVLEAYGPQDEELVAGWMLDVCDTLDYLHHQDPPIIYRDMKPSNIMLSQEGKIKIIDFGIAREFKGDRDDTLPLGTRGYASPEHFTKKTDARSDVYTVGVTMYQLLTGKDPADPPYEILPLREVNPALSSGLEKIIKKATMLDPEDRYQSASEMADAIQSYKKLEEEYIDSIKKDVIKYRISLFASVFVMLLGIGLFTAGVIIDNNTYSSLVNDVTPNIEKRISNLEKAADLKPLESEPYLDLIEAMGEDGKFTEEENVRLTEIYNRHKDSINKNPKKGSEINYQIGESILKYFTGSSDNSSRAKLLTAEPYFEKVTDKNFSKYVLAGNYVFMADYYKNHVLVSDSLVADDTSSKSYNGLIKSIKSTLKNIEGYDDDKSGKMKLVTFDIIINLLDNERGPISESGIREEELLGITDNISSSLADIKGSSDAIEEEKGDLQKKIKELRKNIENTYKNREKIEK